MTTESERKMRERVACAIWTAEAPSARSYEWGDITETAKAAPYRAADAAIRELAGQIAIEAAKLNAELSERLHRVTELADELDADCGQDRGRHILADLIREAVGASHFFTFPGEDIPPQLCDCPMGRDHTSGEFDAYLKGRGAR